MAAAVSANDQILGFSTETAAGLLLFAGEDFSSVADFFSEEDEEGEESAEVDDEFRHRGDFSSAARRAAAEADAVAVAGEEEEEKEDFSGEEAEDVGETTRLRAVCLAGRPGL